MRKPSRKKTATLEYFNGKIPPQDIELEKSILGTIMIDRNAMDIVSSDFTVQLFFDVKHMSIANALLQLYRKNQPIDILTVTNELKTLGDLESSGGASYISMLTSRIASSANFEYHFRILQESALKRVLIQVCGETLQQVWNPEEDVFDVFNGTQLNLENALKAVMSYQIQQVGDIHAQNMKESTEVAIGGHKSGVVTGLTMLDNVTNGWQKSDLIILAGRPSMGKTAAAISMAMHPTIKEGIPVGIFSLEMSNQQLVSRMESFLSGVNVGAIVKKQISLQEIEQIDALCKDLKDAPMYIDDTPNLSLLEFKGKARKLVREKGVKMIIIDYLQLMRSGMRTQSREQEIAEISRGLKAIAKELDIPVIALSQLSRSVEQRGGDKKPILSDLRESGQIEQDADMVIFCYRPEYYAIEEYEVGGETFPTHGLFMLLVAKHRNGELGEIPLEFIHEQTKITNRGYGNNENNRTFVQQDKSMSGPNEVRGADEANTEGFLKNPEDLSNDIDMFEKSDDDDVPF
jgi:replicative DNA helicase